MPYHLLTVVLPNNTLKDWKVEVERETSWHSGSQHSFASRVSQISFLYRPSNGRIIILLAVAVQWIN